MREDTDMIKRADQNYIAAKYPSGSMFLEWGKKKKGYIAMWVITLIVALILAGPIISSVMALSVYIAEGNNEMIIMGSIMLLLMIAILAALIFTSVTLTRRRVQSGKDYMEPIRKRYPYYTEQQLRECDRQICSGGGIFLRDDTGVQGRGDMILTQDWIKLPSDELLYMEDICAAYYSPNFNGTSASYLVLLDKRKRMTGLIFGKYEIDSVISVIQKRNPWIFTDRNIQVNGRTLKLPKEAELVVAEYEKRKRNVFV